jgi:hypothetical protein
MRTLVLSAVLALTALGAGLLATGPSGAEAQERPDGRPRPELVAVAIGQLNPAEGRTAWLSLQAGKVGDRARGNFRYYSPGAGYYNGNVRLLTVENGAIHAEGAGGLHRPDGTRVRVRFTVDISADGSQTTVSIKGADYEYSKSGALDGHVHAGAPPARMAARPQ